MNPKDSILIVDDDPEIRQLLVDYLARNGFDAKPAGTGREMWQMLDRHAIDSGGSGPHAARCRRPDFVS